MTSERKVIELDSTQVLMMFRLRRRMHPVWRWLLTVSESLVVLGFVVRIICGQGPTWWTVLGALMLIPAVGWLWDDHQRRKLDKSVEVDA